MTARRRPLSFGFVLLAGIAMGWGLATVRPAKILANGADRWGERALTSGPIGMDMLSKDVPIARDALYYLNYSTGKLLAAIPTFEHSGASKQLMTEFAERDLIADFGIKPGQDPHFLMTTGSLGSGGAGWSPLFVIETETGQMATYKVAPQGLPGSNRPAFGLLDRRMDRRLGRAMAASAGR